MISLVSMLVEKTKQAIYDRGREVAASVGLNTTSWVSGDPTRATFWYLADVLYTLQGVVKSYIASRFLDTAVAAAEADASQYDWLVLHAQQAFGYEAQAATYAATTITLTNAGGGIYPLEVGALTVQASATGKTYRNTSAGTLAAGGTLTLDITADEAGSASNAAAGEIDTLVTTLLGVTCSNASAAVGYDAEAPASIAAGCRAKLGSMSPNGPRDAYNYVARNAALTGTSAVTRTITLHDSIYGHVYTYLAGPSGAVGAGVVTAVQTALERWCTPLCVTPHAVSATPVVVPVTYEIWIYASVGALEADIKTAISTALASMFAARPIGGDLVAGDGYVFQSLIESTIRSVYPAHCFRCVVSSPASDVALTATQVPMLGTVTGTVNFVSDP